MTSVMGEPSATCRSRRQLETALDFLVLERPVAEGGGVAEVVRQAVGSRRARGPAVAAEVKGVDVPALGSPASAA